jgi:hypothetical protein
MSNVSASRAISADEMRMTNYRNLLEQKNDLQIKDIEDRHTQDVERITVSEADQMQNLRQAYNVKFSEEAEALEDKLAEVRNGNLERVAAEKRVGDAEVNKLKDANQQRIEEYKKISEMQIEQLHKNFKTTSDALHEQAKKTAKREREFAGS